TRSTTNPGGTWKRGIGSAPAAAGATASTSSVAYPSGRRLMVISSAEGQCAPTRGPILPAPGPRANGRETDITWPPSGRQAAPHSTQDSATRRRPVRSPEGAQHASPGQRPG